MVYDHPAKSSNQNVYSIKSNTIVKKIITYYTRSSMSQVLKRTCMSLPDNLLDQFDEIIEKRGYSSRSEGIRDAIRNYIINYKWMEEVEGERIGTISLVYEHDQRGLVNNLTEIEHTYTGLINTSVHLHLDNNNCLEIIMLRGEGKVIKEVAEKMMALKGVKYVKLNTISPNIKPWAIS
jgi:CopG family nickel-responsive transcriptional regulator